MVAMSQASSRLKPCTSSFLKWSSVMSSALEIASANSSIAFSRAGRSDFLQFTQTCKKTQSEAESLCIKMQPIKHRLHDMGINKKKSKGKEAIKNFPDRYLGQVQWNANLELWLSPTSAKKSSLLTLTVRTSFFTKHL